MMKQFAELYKRVIAFNTKAGVKDEEPFTMEWWKVVDLQTKLSVEEATEAYDAAQREDITEVLDGCIDSLVINFKLAQMLQAAGCDVIGAFEAVCNNNDSKVFSSYYEAVEAKEQLEERDDQEYSIETAICNGMPYYSVRRFDGKIMKKVGFVPVSLDKFIP
jgi:hypothetical protein